MAKDRRKRAEVVLHFPRCEHMKKEDPLSVVSRVRCAKGKNLCVLDRRAIKGDLDENCPVVLGLLNEGTRGIINLW